MVPLINLAPPASALYPPVPTAQDAAALADTQSQTNERNAKAAHENEQAAALQRAAAREARDQKSVRDAFLESNGDENKFHEGMLRRGVTPKVIFDNVSELSKHHEQIAKTSKEEKDLQAKVAAQHASEFGGLLSLDQETEAPAQYLRMLPQWRKEGMDLPDQYDPVRARLEATAGMLRDKQLEADRQREEQNNKNREQVNKDAQEGRAAALAGPALREANAKATAEEQKVTGTAPISPYEQAQLQYRQLEIDRQLNDFNEKVRHNKADETETKRYHDMSVEGVTLTPEAKGKMAEMFATTGVLPNLGMGKEAAKNRSDIINQASRDFPNVDFATNKAAYQANQNSLKNIQKQQDALESFENTAGKNLDNFLNTAKKVIDTGSPWINAPLRSISGKVLGDEDQAAFNTARQVAVTEIAKVLNNPNGSAAVSDSNRKEIQELIGTNASLKQIYKAAEILRTDMGNRRMAGREQLKAIQDRIGGKPEEAPAGGAPSSGPKKGDKQNHMGAGYTFDGTQWVKDK